MTESAKTLTYVAIAAVMAAAGLFLAPGAAKPKQDALESLIGTEFYPDFTESAEATSIEVIGYDPVTATVKLFGVEYQNGLWRIPTRHDYPADAKDRLAKVAASIIGLKRQALAGKSESEQAEFQVLDPQAEKAESFKGVGNRVTLKKGNTILADYIIGKAVPGKEGFFFVRKPDEKQTFYAKVDLNLSTKFADWIESDVLNIDGAKLSRIDILKHTLELTRKGPELVGEEHNVLTRDKSSDPWKLAGLDDAAEEVDQDEVKKVVTALDELKIVGVRPKNESLRKSLSSDEGIQLDQQTAEDLTEHGFVILRSSRGGVQMISKEGNLVAGTDQGVEYQMHFGTVFEGSEEEMELGFAKPKEKVDEDQPADGSQPDEGKSDAAKSDGDKSTGKKKSRFIFVTARVNPELLGPELVEPTKPEPPTEKPKDDAPPPDEKTTDEKKTDEKKPDEKEGDAKEKSKDEKPAADDKPKDEKPADEKPAEESKETPPVDPKKAYEEALQDYEVAQLKYDADVKSRAAKIKEAEAKVKTLNARFAEWYYVISAESFENLRQGRSTLVKAKPEPEKPATETPDGEQPKDEPKEEAEQPAAKKEEPAKPATEKAAPKATPKSK